MSIQWHRKHLRPWGYSIGYYDEAFLTVRGVTRSIHRHYGARGGLKFYSFVRATCASRGDRYVYRNRSLKPLLAALRRDTRPIVEKSAGHCRIMAYVLA